YVDSDGLFWLSTRGAGVICHDPRTGREEQYTMRNGFPNNMVYAAFEDHAGHLWFSTDGGIVRMDKGSRQSMVYTVADGITNDEFNRLAFARSSDGTIYFGGLNGITAFNPVSIEPNETAPNSLVITGLRRYSNEQRNLVDVTVEVLRTGRVDVHGGDGSLEIGFSLLSFDPPERNTYAWRVRGVQDEWVYQHAASVRLDRLPEGEHLLEVKGADATGRWSSRMLELPIVVHHAGVHERWLWLGAGTLIPLAVIVPLGRFARKRRLVRRMRSALA
ncbi:MAG TPA: two-component regulator propeller domain-containing protein, partial [Flavobacteriales bacterium]|nr:two-component regulator propeller domain-containing protein [Flavobacteriales bacterium]